MTSSDEMFAEAANNWDLERLYKAMAEAKWQVSP
ncbi:MAG: DNA-binding response regulator, partial [Oscillatoriales cyanobacterium]